jgi:hypothetical protein
VGSTPPRSRCRSALVPSSQSGPCGRSGPSSEVPEDRIALSELPSAARAAPSASRVDPYHERLWPSGVGGATVSWAGRDEMEAWGQVFAHSRQRCAEAFLSRERGARLAALSALQMWRMLTTEQLAAITGDTRWMSRCWPEALTLGLGAGWLQVGRFALAGRPSGRRRYDISAPREGLPMLLRLVPEAIGGIERHLGYAEWLSVSCGRPWATRVGYNRHGVLAAEASLRVAEHLSVGTVLGETVSDLASMLGVGTWRRADAAWVRADGLVLAVEVSAAASTGLPAKAEWWADTMASRPDEPVAVLFLVASPRTKWGQSWQHDIPQCVARAAHGSLAAVSAGVAKRMLVAFWEDWWPRKGFATSRFLSLRAARPTGPKAADPWEEVDLTDPFAFPGPGKPGPVIENAALLGGVPEWLRRGRKPPDLTPVMWEAAGLPLALRGGSTTRP